jgi:hypothetical protein
VLELLPELLLLELLPEPMQVPPLHVCPAAQAWLQLPQCMASVQRSTQLMPPQSLHASSSESSSLSVSQDESAFFMYCVPARCRASASSALRPDTSRSAPSAVPPIDGDPQAAAARTRAAAASAASAAGPNGPG